MSIINCNKCAKAIDTDYNTESIIEQKGQAVCLDCAIEEAYSYRVKDYDSDYDNAYLIGWIGGLNLDDAIDKLQEKFNVSERDVEVKPLGQDWKSYYQRLIKES